jgi:Right handed beta helix region
MKDYPKVYPANTGIYWLSIKIKGDLAMNSLRIVLILLMVFMPCVSFSATIHVPGDYPTIQDGINASLTGDIVLVDPGTYFENLIVLPGHEICLKSSHGPALTEINGMDDFTVLIIETDITVDGFTIRNGYGYPGGILVHSNAEIRNCWVVENSGFDLGGGIACLSPSGNALIINNIIAWNNCYPECDAHGFPEDDSYGAGVYVSINAQANIINNTIVGNIAHGDESHPAEFYGRGGGLWIDGECPAIVANNIITDNEAGLCPAVAGYGWPDVIFELNDIWNNHGDSTGCEPPDPGLRENPLFVCGQSGGFYLSHIAAGQDQNSPCINFGNDTAHHLGLDIYTTRTDNVPDHGVVDLGYHYKPTYYLLTIKLVNENRLHQQ